MKLLKFVDNWLAISRKVMYTYECNRYFPTVSLAISTCNHHLYGHTEGNIMPTTNDIRIAPKSVLRHRPIGDRTSLQGSGGNAHAPISVVQRASRLRSPESDGVAEWECVTETADTQKGKAAQEALHARRAPTRVKTLTRAPRSKGGSPKDTSTRVHPLLYLGLGMLAIIALWMLLSALLSWVNVTVNDIRYGRPRTFQTDAWVGHNEQTGLPSHFIALNLSGHIEIIEIAGGDPAHSHIYSGPQLYGSGSDLVPVTLTFVDVNGDHKLDMIIQLHSPGSSSNIDPESMVLINTGTTFRPLTPSELPQVEKFLQHLRQ